MGNDGGSIPKRRELVKEAAKSLTAAQLKEAQNEQQEYGWTTDPLTRKQLARPVVSDAAGILYNKDSIIEFLLKEDGDREKDEMKKVAGVKGTVEGGFAELGNFGDRVKGLKDVVEVKFEVSEGERELGGRGEKWVCPITGRELGPGAKACYIVPCGHAFAGSVVKEIKGGACLQVRLYSRSHEFEDHGIRMKWVGIKANDRAVQRTLRRKRCNTHPTHPPNRRRALKPPRQNTTRKGPHARAQESAG